MRAFLSTDRSHFRRVTFNPDGANPCDAARALAETRRGLALVRRYGAHSSAACLPRRDEQAARALAESLARFVGE